jgi:hypothetical protein
LRDVEDDILGRGGSCDPAADWDRLAQRALRGGLRGPARADLDLYLYEYGRAQPIAMSSRRGTSREAIEYIARPGRYEVAVHAYRRSATGAIRIYLD